ncbi:glycosyltransferase involved in cell wall biosynthesis [Streptosporangium becharense]|uniref:Glycosyltransferase involved in cell wall biosynthesis n=1 Tax=Streptosporangium becharense TaxID=1816182 RepID=A0A7W9IIA7_9ACTN|nr:glycosyltransferase [Streptosporangium becharense]MBB2912527.1 glycosyltransferase involved in cell wall biosynthesis [Streptosporangium becharense]MBB5820643.1 glycosyltransferase involved in cell wall biosynthesis [Streptosporangium becharense]
MRICLLVPSAYGMRGDVRSVVNLAGELAERHDVEILSVRRHREKPFFPIEPAVNLSWVVDARPGVRRLFPRGQMSTEVALWRRLRTLRADVLITTRPALGVQAARHAPREMLRIAREWGRPPVPGPIRKFYPRLDGVVTATEASRQEWVRLLDGRTPVSLIPDALPAGPWPRSRMDNRIVAAGGRLVAAKAHDRLIRAFAIVAGKCPGWRLRLYGGGPEEKRLRDLVASLGLHNHVYFMGTTPDLAGEFAKASIVATASRTEELGMTVIEAMASGVPVIAFDSPRGPGEFVTHGRSGVLVPEGEGEIEAYASALLALIDDERRRRELAAGALGAAAVYGAPAVAARWEELITGTSRGA